MNAISTTKIKISRYLKGNFSSFKGLYIELVLLVSLVYQTSLKYRFFGFKFVCACCEQRVFYRRKTGINQGFKAL